MTDQHEIIRFIDDYLRKHDLEGLAVADAARLLNEAGLLPDDGQNPGEPLRKLLRDGEIPHARKSRGAGSFPLPARPQVAKRHPPHRFQARP